MLKRLRNRLTLLAACLTGSVVVAVCIISFILIRNQYANSRYTAFQLAAESVYTQWELEGDISTEWLAANIEANVANVVLWENDLPMDHHLVDVETAQRLRQLDPNCLIVFITTSLEHGADAFDVDAFHYLVKPLNVEKLEAVMRRWKNILSEIQTVTLKCSRSLRQVPVREIMYIEVAGRVSTVHTVNEVIPTSMTLSSLEELLPSEQFVKPIRYLLAALRYIQNVGDTQLTLTDGTALSFSRGERENLRQTLSAYRLRQLRRR